MVAETTAKPIVSPTTIIGYIHYAMVSTSGQFASCSPTEKFPLYDKNGALTAINDVPGCFVSNFEILSSPYTIETFTSSGVGSGSHTILPNTTYPAYMGRFTTNPFVKLTKRKLFVLISGVGGNIDDVGGSFSYIKKQLNANLVSGLDRVVYYGYNNENTISVEDMANGFNDWLVSNKVNAQDYSEVFFITHGFGEVVLRQAGLTAPANVKDVYDGAIVNSISPTLGGDGKYLNVPCSVPILNERNPLCSFEQNLFSAANKTAFAKVLHNKKFGYVSADFAVAGNPSGSLGSELLTGDHNLEGIWKAVISKYGTGSNCATSSFNSPLASDVLNKWLPSYLYGQGNYYFEYYYNDNYKLCSYGTSYSPSRAVTGLDWTKIENDYDSHTTLLTYKPVVQWILNSVTALKNGPPVPGGVSITNYPQLLLGTPTPTGKPTYLYLPTITNYVPGD